MSGCPACGSDLRGEPIPDLYFVHYMEDDPVWDRSRHRSHEQQLADQEQRNARYVQEGKEWMVSDVRCFCLPYGDRAPEDRFFSRMVGYDIQGVYDGILFWGCEDCGHLWPRFTSEGWGDLHDKAVEYIDKIKAERAA